MKGINRPIHFEIQADDINRSKDFYEKTFGWQITQAMKKEDGGMDYWSINTGDGPGIGGGMYERATSDEKFYLFDCTILVEDIDKSIEAVKANGGTIVREKGEIKGVGHFAVAKDTEGNRFGIMQSTGWEPK